LLAKGKLLGIQFETLFEDGLYYEISNHAVEMAMMIREAFVEKTYSIRICFQNKSTVSHFAK